MNTKIDPQKLPALPLNSRASYFRHTWDWSSPINSGKLTLTQKSINYISDDNTTVLDIPISEIKKVRTAASLMVKTKQKQVYYFGMLSAKEQVEASIPAIAGGALSGTAAEASVAGGLLSYKSLKKLEELHGVPLWQQALGAMGVPVETQLSWMIKIGVTGAVIIGVVALLMNATIK